MNVGHQAELMGFCQTRKKQHRGEKHDLDTQKEVKQMEKELIHLHTKKHQKEQKYSWMINTFIISKNLKSGVQLLMEQMNS